MARRLVAVIEARMGSSRLPGKVLLQAQGVPMIGHLISRLQSVGNLDDIVVATTVNPIDEPIHQYCASRGVSVFNGSENDVLDRVVRAAKSMKATDVVSVTADCPIIDPDIVAMVIDTHLLNPSSLYTSNCHFRTYPDGMDVQVTRLEALVSSSAQTTDPLHREHVTLHIRMNPGLYPQVHIAAPPSLHWPELGLTLDEYPDYEFIRGIIDYFSSSQEFFSCLDVITLLRNESPSLIVNSNVVRKGIL